LLLSLEHWIPKEWEILLSFFTSVPLAAGETLESMLSQTRHRAVLNDVGDIFEAIGGMCMLDHADAERVSSLIAENSQGLFQQSARKQITNLLGALAEQVFFLSSKSSYSESELMLLLKLDRVVSISATKSVPVVTLATASTCSTSAHAVLDDELHRSSSTARVVAEPLNAEANWNTEECPGWMWTDSSVWTSALDWKSTSWSDAGSSGSVWWEPEASHAVATTSWKAHDWKTTSWSDAGSSCSAWWAPEACDAVAPTSWKRQKNDASMFGRSNDASMSNSGRKPPFRKSGDDRFNVRNRDRKYVCDQPDCPQVVGFSGKQYAAFWGQYLHRASWKQIKVQELEAGYNDGTYDCTWLCVACFGKRLGITDEEKVAREIGVYGNETHRQAQWSKQSYR